MNVITTGCGECIYCFNGMCSYGGCCSGVVHKSVTTNNSNTTVIGLPFNVGDKVWHFEYEDGVPYEEVCSVFIGGNSSYAFLSPIIWDTDHDIDGVNELCAYAFNEYVRGDINSVFVVPYSECFLTRELAIQYLSKIKKEV